MNVMTENQTYLSAEDQKHKVQSEIEESLAGAGIGMWTMVLTNDGDSMLFANKVMNELLGTTEDMAPQERYERWIAGITEESQEATAEYMDSIRRDGKAEVIYTWMHPTRCLLHIRCGSVQDRSYKDGIKVRGYHQDITAVQNAEEAHKEELREQDSVIEAVSSIYLIVWIFDLKTGNVKVIREVDGLETPAQDAEFESEKTIETLLRDYVVEEDRDQMRRFYNLDRLATKLSTEKSVSTEFRDTRLGWCRATAIPVRTGGEEELNRILIGVQKIDEEKEAELRAQKLLSEAYEEAKRANAAKTEFLSRMSHDIRTPINGILGMARIAEQCIDDRERVKDALTKIDEAGRQLELLINDVLDMSRLESGRTELTREPFDLVKVLGSGFDPIAVMARENDVKLAGAHYNIKHSRVIGSPLHLQRISLNILTNAVKYNKPGGSAETWLDEIPIDDTHSNYVFRIADTGVGMSEEFRKHLFEPFSREHTDAGTRYQGTGLGMAITKELLDLMGGSIEVESKPGVGSTFTMKIPFEICTDEIVEEKPEVHEEIRLDGMRILLVEDNSLNMEIAKFMVETAGAVVTTASNGREAVDTYRNHPAGSFDVILMDVMMPEIDGLTATRMIRESGLADSADIPIIAMTANAFAEDVKKCMDAGMNEHIAKPLDADKALHIIAGYNKKHNTDK